jgi:hypothetical protein
MDTAELDQFIGDAKAMTEARNAEAARQFRLGGYPRYELDLETQALIFFNSDDRPTVASRAIPVGTLAKESKSWLWSWENESIPKEISAPMNEVRSFGAKHDIDALQQTFSPCDEALAWALAAVSLKLLDAQTVYRIDQSKTQLFLLLFDLRRIGE